MPDGLQGGSQQQGFGLVIEERNEVLVVQSVAPGSNAASAGLQPGDVIVKLGGVETATVAEFDEITGIMQPGDQIGFQVRRRGKEVDGLLQFGATPEPDAATAVTSDLNEGPSLLPSDTGETTRQPLQGNRNGQADFVPNPNAGQSRSALVGERQIFANPQGAVGTGVNEGARGGFRQPTLPGGTPGHTVEQLQATILQQQQVIRQLQREIDELKQRVPSQSRRRN